MTDEFDYSKLLFFTVVGYVLGQLTYHLLGAAKVYLRRRRRPPLK